MSRISRWRAWARTLKLETYTLYLAYRDPRVPWYAKVCAMLVAGYAFSPIDLIPDFIPVLGYLDDFLLVPLGVALVLRLIPPPVLADCRVQARMAESKPRNWIAAAIIVALWLLVAFWVVARW